MRTIITTIGLAGALALCAQGPLSISFQQAQDLAAKQSYAVQASVLEAQKAEQRIKELTGMGLPQIAGSAEISDFIDVPTQLIPNFFSPPGSGAPEYVPVSFGVPWSAKGTLQLNQLLFDGSYLTGLKAAKEYRTKTNDDEHKAEADARNQAAKAYLGVLAAEEGVRLTTEGIPLLEKAVHEVTEMQKAGFMETTDVDRLTIQLEQTQAQKRSFQQQADVARMLLALTLGVPQGTPLTLTDQLDKLISDGSESGLVEQPFDPKTHIEEIGANDVIRLQELDVRNHKAKAMPSLYGYFSHQQNWYGPDFQPIDGPYRWYPTTLWGLKLDVPIFSSGARYHALKQSQLGLEQAKVNLTATEQRLIANAEQARSQARTALDNYATEKRNMELAKNIFDRTTVKFNNGSSASFELTQEHGNYLLAQQRYIQQLVQLLMARADLRKALDLY